MHTILIVLFKSPLYSSTFVIYVRSFLKVVLSQNSYCNTIGHSSFIQNLHVMPTFKTEMLHLVSNVQLVKWLFTAKRKANTALPCSFSTVTHDMFRY